MRPINPLPTILVDTREKTPWDFQWALSHKQVASVETEKIDAGDYTIKEIPNLVIVERKRDVAEIYANLIPKLNYERFLREMGRLQSYKYKFIVVEDHWESLWNINSFKYLGKNKKWAGSIVMSSLFQIMTTFNVHVLFAGDKAEQITLKLLTKFYNKELDERRILG